MPLRHGLVASRKRIGGLQAATSPSMRLLHGSRPTEVIGPLMAGIGVAGMLYGTKMLLELASGAAAKRPTTGDDGPTRASSEPEDARSSGFSSPSSDGMRPAESYFTTSAMGIDLGHGAKEWSGACAAIVSGGGVRVVENEQGSRCTPNAIAFTDSGEVVVGQPAKNLLFSRSAKTVVGHGLLHGVEYGSAECDELLAAGLFPFEVTADAQTNAALVRVHSVSHAPEAMSARMLSQLKASSEEALGGSISILSAVIGSPVLATEPTRDALLAAGKRAGLHRVELIDEPVAAALAAELEIGSLASARRLGVYDLGGRSFSFSVLERQGGSAAAGERGSGAAAEEAGEGSVAGWSVLAARRRTLLGGESFDDALVESLVEGFKEEHGIDLTHDPLALQRLHEAAEGAKVELSSSSGMAAISLPFITADASGPKHMDVTISRAKFDALAQPTLKQTSSVSEEALRAASLRPSDLDAILLTGGSARLSAVVDHAAALFGRSPLRTARPEEAIALGAAVHAQHLQALQYGGR